MTKANIGVVGLAVMGSNLARNLASRDGQHGRGLQPLAAEDPRPGRRSIRRPASSPARSIEDFVASLAKPRTAIIMVQGRRRHRRRDRRSSSELFEPGDIIVDGGNAQLPRHHPPREGSCARRASTSSAPASPAARRARSNGPSIMPGGSAESYETLGPILESIAADVDGEPVRAPTSAPDGAGHFVKMVHNGIEYADMQLIAEAYDLLRRGAGLTPAEIADVFAEWNTGELESLPDRDHRRGAAPDGRRDRQAVRRRHRSTQAGRRAPASGPCRTRSTSASRSRGIAEAVFARALSVASPSSARPRGLPGPSAPVRSGRTGDALRSTTCAHALYASKIVAYAQGFDAIVAGADEVRLGHRPGRDRDGSGAAAASSAPQFLNRITEAYAERPRPRRRCSSTPYFAEAVADGAGRLAPGRRGRRAVRHPGPRRSPPRSRYYDALRAERLPAALIQGQRDFFGAHTYQRVDKDGTFHTLWSGDRSEVEAVDTH